MSSIVQNQYTPDYVSPPGETLEEILDERGMTQADLASRMGRPKKTISEIVNGKAAITPDTALQLEKVLGISASFWNNRERHYREFLARQEDNKRLKEQVSWLKQLPVKAIIELGWIKLYQDTVEQLREVLNFFAVASPEQWEAIWINNLSVSFRQSPVFTSDRGAVSAWLRRGEIKASEIDCAEFSDRKFREVLTQIRLLTIQSPEIFQPEMVRLCAESGVALVFVPQLPKTRVCGATRWLNPNKALIQLSLRYKTNDHFWFAFFHEAGHVLLHGKRDVFLEVDNHQDSTEQSKEDEANIFAADFLIPSHEWNNFIQLGNRSKGAIQQFADEIGIHPGIVVGRMQNKAILPHSHCNSLKTKFDWKNSNIIEVR